MQKCKIACPCSGSAICNKCDFRPKLHRTKFHYQLALSINNVVDVIVSVVVIVVVVSDIAVTIVVVIDVVYVVS